LAKAGLLDERREEGGRRRKHYSITAKGREALQQWRTEPATEVPELRDLGILKLFMGAEPVELANAQVAAHEAKLQTYYEIQKLDLGNEPRGPWVALDAGIEYEKHMIRYWKGLADSGA
jgi:DNA-binding PadR family transcriptional regulator